MSTAPLVLPKALALALVLVSGTLPTACQSTDAARTTASTPGPSVAQADALPSGEASPVGEATPPGDTRPVGEATPHGDTRPAGETTPHGDTRPAGETTPLGKVNPAGSVQPQPRVGHPDGPASERSGDQGEQKSAGSPGSGEEPSDPAGLEDSDAPVDPDEFNADKVEHVTEVALPAERAAILGRKRLTLRDVYWGGRIEGRVIVDTLHFDDAEFEAILAATEAGELAAEVADPLPPRIEEHPALVTFRAGETMTVIGPRRIQSLGLESFFASAGASEGNLHAFFEPSKNPPKQSLVLRGPADGTARLREPVSVSRSKAIVAEAKRQIAGDRSASRLSRSNVTAMKGGFPVAESRLVTVVVSLRPEDPDNEYPGYWAGLWVQEPGGRVLSVVAPRRRSQRIDVRHLVDIDGDGVDEIVFQTDDVHSGYWYLAVWDGKAYRNLRLIGSGG